MLDAMAIDRTKLNNLFTFGLARKIHRRSLKVIFKIIQSKVIVKQNYLKFMPKKNKM